MDIHQEMKNELAARRASLEREKEALLSAANRIRQIDQTLAELDAEDKRLDDILETKLVADGVSKSG